MAIFKDWKPKVQINAIKYLSKLEKSNSKVQQENIDTLRNSNSFCKESKREAIGKVDQNKQLLKYGDMAQDFIKITSL